MSQGFSLASPRMRFWDSNGAVLAGGKVYFYIAGSSTPQNTWSDSALTSLNTNPVILSASGEATVFVPSATLYKLDLFSATNVHQSGYPLDGLEAIPAPDPPAPTPSPVPTGGIILYGGAAAPSGYLLANGALVSRATYAALFTAIGVTFGAGDGSTTFAIPDLRQRFPLGVAASGTGNTLGGTGGAIDHTHTGPSHTHDTTVLIDGWPENLFTQAHNRLATFNEPTAASDRVFTSTAAGTGLTGTANAPFLALNYLIKT